MTRGISGQNRFNSLMRSQSHPVFGHYGIDILARDRSELPVIIELMVNRGHEKTVGQALYYRARIKQRFGAERVRIFIIAAEISPELRAAASEVSDVLLFECGLAVKVTAITI